MLREYGARLASVLANLETTGVASFLDGGSGVAVFFSLILIGGQIQAVFAEPPAAIEKISARNLRRPCQLQNAQHSVSNTGDK
jgi:hypothetical protein